MTSTADRLAHQQQKAEGIGTNQKAVKFCDQDYDTLRQKCLNSGRLFQDDFFNAESKSLGYNELGPYSSKTRGIVWKRPTFVLRLEDVDDDPLDGKDGCTFLVGLMQKEGRQKRKLNRDLETIGFAIYKVNVRLGPDVLLRQNSVAMSDTFINTREVCSRFKLPPGEYAIIPSTFQPHKNGSFVLRVFSEKEAKTRNKACSAETMQEIPLLVPDTFQTLYLSRLRTSTLIFESDPYQLHDNTELIFLFAGFHIDSALLQAIVNRYADVHYAVDFDNFVGCLIKLEMNFSE
ncbi:hypothetical protein GOODEAATRI_020485 [Goodea atripinnis]|uniref:Peptidase C2 calpain domain-containing protein n=1 Tax=Goodea atripinnis TaxID=208336 RepID=A0ABV0Q097_9TELE